MPASNDPRVRVDEKKNSIASTLSRRYGCGSPKARLRFKSQATSRTVSTSSFVKSRSPMKSRPLKFVCILIVSLLFFILFFSSDGGRVQAVEITYKQNDFCYWLVSIWAS